MTRLPPWALFTYVGPDSALLHASPQSFVSSGEVQYPDRGIVACRKALPKMSASISSDSPYHGAATPTYKCAFGKFGPHPLENFMLAVKGQMVVKLRDKQMRQEVRPFHAAWDRTTGGRFLHHPLAAPTGFPREHTHVTPPFSAVIKRLRKSILLGASHHLNPLRFMKIIPLSTHLSS